MSPFNKSYSPLTQSSRTSEDGDEDTLLTSNEKPRLDIEDVPRHNVNPYNRLFWACVAMFTSSLLLFTISIWLLLSFQSNHNNALLRATSHYSPLFDHVDIPLKDVTFNGSLMQPDPPSIYRMDPSPEVDAAWTRLGNTQTSAVSSEEVRKMGWNPDELAKYPDDFGLGDDAYIVEIDVFHQIHCLNSLRMNLQPNFNYYYGKNFPDGKVDEKHKTHMNHCLHMILQNLMCHGDTDAILHRWWDFQYLPLPDFSIKRQCRDFDTLLAWQESHHVDLEKYYQIRRPLDVEPFVTPEGFRDLFGLSTYTENDVDHPGDFGKDIDYDCWHSSKPECQGRNGYFGSNYMKQPKDDDTKKQQ